METNNKLLIKYLLNKSFDFHYMNSDKNKSVFLIYRCSKIFILCCNLLKRYKNIKNNKCNFKKIIIQYLTEDNFLAK